MPSQTPARCRVTFGAALLAMAAAPGGAMAEDKAAPAAMTAELLFGDWRNAEPVMLGDPAPAEGEMLVTFRPDGTYEMAGDFVRAVSGGTPVAVRLLSWGEWSWMARADGALDVTTTGTTTMKSDTPDILPHEGPFTFESTERIDALDGDTIAIGNEVLARVAE